MSEGVCWSDGQVSLTFILSYGACLTNISSTTMPKCCFSSLKTVSTKSCVFYSLSGSLLDEKEFEQGQRIKTAYIQSI